VRVRLSGPQVHSSSLRSYLSEADGFEELHKPEWWGLALFQVDGEAMRGGCLDDIERGIERSQFMRYLLHELVGVPLVQPITDPGIPHAKTVLHEERGQRKLAAALEQNKGKLPLRATVRVC
jgi:hypothetical protein